MACRDDSLHKENHFQRIYQEKLRFLRIVQPDDFPKSILPHTPLQQIAVLIDHFVQRSVRALGYSLGKLTDRVNLQRILRQRSDVAVLVIDQGRFPVSQYDSA